MEDRITYVGLDVHKEGIVVAVAEGGLLGEVREYGRIANTAAALDRLVRKLGGEGVRLRSCYEAGPCGYGIQRHLSARGHECVVVAPSLIPKRAGDRVKTDRRDAAGLARLHRAGELTAVWVPDAQHEAMRDLVRARLDAVHALRRARQQLWGFLLRQGCHWRTLVSTICRVADPTLVARPRQLRDASAVMRFQPAHQSMINRRHDGRASRPALQSLQQMLERKPRIYLPATCKGGHESGRGSPWRSSRLAHRRGRSRMQVATNAGTLQLARSMS